MVRRRRRFADAPAEEPFLFPDADSVVALWTLRLLVRAGALSKMRAKQRWPDSDVLAAIGLNESYVDELDPSDVPKLLSDRLDELERRGARTDGAVWSNARLLGAELSLSALEQDIVAFAAVVTMRDGPSDCLTALAPPSLQSLCRAIAVALGVRGNQVREAFDPAGTLMTARLIKIALRSTAPFGDTPLELAEPLQRIFQHPHEDAEALLRSFFRSAPAPEFGLEDFPHLAEDVPILVRFVRSSLRQRTKGVNILVHGPPGTGKTQLARAVAAHVGATLYEVSVEDDEGDVRWARTSAYAVCQRTLARRPDTLVLLDELEDAIPEPPVFPFRRARYATVEKGWLNRMLETNPVPSIWIGNTIDHVDPAVLRRFDFVMEVREPPPVVRRKMIERHTEGLGVGDAWVERTSGDRRIGPGHLERAAKVARVIGPDDALDAERILSRVLDASLETSVRGAAPRDDLPQDFDLSYFNTDCDLPSLLAGLDRCHAASLCLFGPPGTGKTVFARHVARHLGMPLHAHRASDLLGSFVGQTEARLARVFAAARHDQAVLFLDEADSFLQDRQRATHSWEVTQVNELLVQMEAFDGVLLCATNLPDVFDVAAARRFDLQIRFDPLTPDAAYRMFCSVLAALGGPAPDIDVPEALARLTGLTPGDFAVVRRRLRLLGGEASAARVLAELARESARKPATTRAVGFRGNR